MAIHKEASEGAVLEEAVGAEETETLLHKLRHRDCKVTLLLHITKKTDSLGDFSGHAAVKNPPPNAGSTGSHP